LRVAWAPVLLLLAACANENPLSGPNGRMPAHLSHASFAALVGWDKAELAPAVETFRRSCLSIPQPRDRWADACNAAVPVPKNNEKAARQFFERWFDVYRVHNGGTDQGTFTGYYEAELEGSRKRTKEFRYPVFGRPRHGPRRLSRRAIENCADDWVRALERRRRPSRARACRIVRSWPVLFWANNRVDLFITEIQGSARVRLTDGTVTRIGYAGQNGHRYVAVGRLLIQRDVIDAKDMSMQAIREWLIKNPRDGRRLMHENPSFVFFKERKENADEIGARGALNVPLTPGRSIAVDPRYIPLGAPVWLETTWPKVPPEELAKARRTSTVGTLLLPRLRPSQPPANPPAPKAAADENKPAAKKPQPETPPADPGDPGRLTRLLIAQDTGGVIKGPVRGDVYWGTGAEAFLRAGYMNQTGRWFLLLPKGYYGRLPLPPPASDPRTTAPAPAAKRRTFRILPSWLRL
jgi:membrane-bound lytic murein transglycosylase A